MRRWHSEMALMLRRREERRRLIGYGPSWRGGIREAGLTFWRKRHPLDCGNPRCGCCHYEKYAGKRRANDRRNAIEYEIEAYDTRPKGADQ